MTALMSSRASESVSVGTFWNSPSLRSVVASSSPVGFSREREVGAVLAMIYFFRCVKVYGGGTEGRWPRGFESN